MKTIAKTPESKLFVDFMWANSVLCHDGSVIIGIITNNSTKKKILPKILEGSKELRVLYIFLLQLVSTWIFFIPNLVALSKP